MEKEKELRDEETTIGKLKELVIKFRDEREWKKYHKPKDLAISISIEASELLELFQWLNEKEIEEKLKNENYIKRIKEEIADIIIYCLNFADILNIDISKVVVEKIKKNEEKYPIEKYKGIFFKDF